MEIVLGELFLAGINTRRRRGRRKYVEYRNAVTVVICRVRVLAREEYMIRTSTTVPESARSLRLNKVRRSRVRYVNDGNLRSIVFGNIRIMTGDEDARGTAGYRHAANDGGRMGIRYIHNIYVVAAEIRNVRVVPGNEHGIGVILVHHTESSASDNAWRERVRDVDDVETAGRWGNVGVVAGGKNAAQIVLYFDSRIDGCRSGIRNVQYLEGGAAQNVGILPPAERKISTDRDIPVAERRSRNEHRVRRVRDIENRKSAVSEIGYICITSRNVDRGGQIMKRESDRTDVYGCRWIRDVQHREAAGSGVRNISVVKVCRVGVVTLNDNPVRRCVRSPRAEKEVRKNSDGRSNGGRWRGKRPAAVSAAVRTVRPSIAERP